MLIYEKSNVNFDHECVQDFANTVNNRAHRYGIIFERQGSGVIDILRENIEI